jgi:hypothetical protein
MLQIQIFCFFPSKQFQATFCMLLLLSGSLLSLDITWPIMSKRDTSVPGLPFLQLCSLNACSGLGHFRNLRSEGTHNLRKYELSLYSRYRLLRELLSTKNARF